jgi:hypothetical protein
MKIDEAYQEYLREFYKRKEPTKKPTTKDLKSSSFEYRIRLVEHLIRNKATIENPMPTSRLEECFGKEHVHQALFGSRIFSPIMAEVVSLNGEKIYLKDIEKAKEYVKILKRLVKEVKIPRPLRIYVSGPITYKNGGKELGELVEFLRKNFECVYHPLEKPIDHSIDFRKKRDLVNKLYRSLEDFIKSDVDVLVADLRGPSDGRTVEQMLSIKYGKPVVAYAPQPVYSPWALAFVTEIAKSLEELVKILKRYEL